MAIVHLFPKFCFALIISAHLSTCIIQQMVLHESETEDGNYYVFKSPVANLPSHNLGAVKRFCYQGLWAVFADVDFGSLEPYDGDTYYAKNYTCKNETIWFKSFRYGGAKDTVDDAISLFSENAFGGTEFYFDGIAIGGITEMARSVIWTGNSSWTIFEGDNFKGNRTCLASPVNGMNGFSYLQTNLQMATVGSIVKGCPTY